MHAKRSMTGAANRVHSLMHRCFPDAAAQWKRVQDVIAGIRSVRSQAGVPPKQQLEAYVKADAAGVALFKAADTDMRRLAGLSKLETAVDLKRPDVHG